MTTHRQVIAGILIALVTCPSFAQETSAYPTRPVRLIFPWAPGSTIDSLTRALAEGMATRLKQPVIVESKVGANGIIAAQALLAAAPDGYTLMIGNEGSYGINSARPQPPYDARRDFTPISRVATTPLFIVVNTNTPYAGLKDMLAEAKRKPGQISYGSIGVGSSSHLAIEKMALLSGVNLIHVPYKGSSEVVTSIQGGHVIFGYNGGLLNVKEGRVRALAVGSATRYPGAPDIPTVKEAAGIADYDETAWFGIVAPRNTPTTIVAKLNAVIVETLSQPAFKEKFSALGFEPAPSTAEELERRIAASVESSATVIRNANIQIN